MHTAILLFGSNIHPEENLRCALDELCACCTLQRVSSTWETLPIGSPGAPNFLNLAAEMCTDLDAQAMKTQLLRPLESRMGRVRTADKNAPRTLDIDIIVFDGQVLDEALWQRSFIALPVAELLPDLPNPNTGECLADFAKRLLPGSGARLRSPIYICP
jgi:2-amino-4-hydroxy-6-hydroxymethyldihydropteridine diphosphokinase